MAVSICLRFQTRIPYSPVAKLTEEKTEAQKGSKTCPEATETGPLNLPIFREKKKIATRMFRCGTVWLT